MLKKCIKKSLKDVDKKKNAHFIIYYSTKTNSIHVFLKKITIKYSDNNI